MRAVSPRQVILWIPLCVILSACLTACGSGGGSDDTSELPLDASATDYSKIALAEAQEDALQGADDQTLLGLLRNGLRLSLSTSSFASQVQASASAPVALPSGTYSDTNVQVEGVDEGDAVKYDGRFIYAINAEQRFDTAPTPNSGFAIPLVVWPSFESTLKIVKSNPANATTETLTTFRLSGRQGTAPVLYRVNDAQQTTLSLAALSQVDVRSAVYGMTSNSLSSSIVMHKPRMRVALLDVRDPLNVSQTWKLEIEGSLRTSRQIGDTLYLVSSHWPWLATLNSAAATAAERQANERLIRAVSYNDLLPHYWQNDGAEQLLAQPRDCLIPSATANDAYRELVFITAINLKDRRVADVACVSAGANGVYASRESLYIGGDSYRRSTGGPAIVPGLPITVLHKFALKEGALEYRASGAVEGTVGWSNSSYFMDEYQGDLRVLTTRHGNPSRHVLSILREAASNKLAVLSTLPNAAHPAPIGKPQEQVRAVRFAEERAYVVTFRQMDPLYVIDLQDPLDPLIAGELEIPGFSAFLKPLGANYLLGVGEHADSNGRSLGAKVELFEISDITHPRVVGSRIFGRSWSEALWDFHALSFVTLTDATLSGAQTRYRMALPLAVYDTPHPTHSDWFTWTYTGLHLFEISGLNGSNPQLHFQGVLKAEEASQSQPSHPFANRSVLHDDSVFYVFGDRIISSLWQDL